MMNLNFLENDLDTLFVFANSYLFMSVDLLYIRNKHKCVWEKKNKM